jgi:hypothetical protein
LLNPISLQEHPIPGAAVFAADLALTPSGPVVAYYSGPPDFAVKVGSVDSRATTVGVAGGPDKPTVTPSLAVGPDGRLGLVYSDDRAGDLVYAERIGAQWITETVDAAGEVGYFPSLAYDDRGIPHISYFDQTNNDIKYAVRDGSTWQIETLDASGQPGFFIPAGFTRIALGCAPDAQPCSERRPMVAYLAYRYKPYDGELRFAIRYAWGWRIETVDSTRGAGGFPAMALDYTGRPWISYYRAGTWDFEAGELRVAHHDGGRWVVTVIDDRDNAGRYSDIAINAEGHPLIAYYAAGRGELRLAWPDGTGWRTAAVAAQNAVGGWVTLAVDPAGVAHMTYVDAAAHTTMYAILTPESL